MQKTPQQLSLPVELLGLSDIEIQNVVLNSNNEIIITVESTKSEIPCHRCGKPTNPHDKNRSVRIRHLPILGKKTFIEIRLPRGICPFCDDHSTTTQTLPWHERNARYTKAYEQHVLLSLVNSTIADVSIKEGFSDTAIQGIVDKHIADKVDWKKIKKIGLLGADEINLKKGYQDYVTLITSRLNGENRILAVIKGREKADIKAFLEGIPKKLHKTVIAVCCDMYDGYINAAKEVFGEKVAIVVDRFHVAKLYRKPLVELRSAELKRLRKELSPEEYKSLKHAISILVKKQECYSKEDKKALKKLFRYSPILKKAYRLTRQLTAIFNTKHKKGTAENKINEWIKTVEASEVFCFDGFVETLKKYKNEVTNYFISRNTSGFVEGLNNKFKVIKRRCYGIFNLKHFFQRIFLDLSRYQLFLNNQEITSMI